VIADKPTRLDKPHSSIRRVLVVVLTLLGLVCAGLSAGAGRSGATSGAFPDTVVPVPASEAADGTTFTLTTAATITSDDANTGGYLAGVLRASTGYALPLTVGSGGHGTIALSLSGAPASVGTEGYRLTVGAGGVLIQAQQAAGLFHGVQTLLQLLPATVMSPTAQPGPWRVPGGTILDHPRFGYRGAMLDIARHFFTVAQVEHYVDELALYKINYLHLHLSDDQGWRIAVDSWPNLAVHGGSTEVGGGTGGYWTKDDYAAVVAHAASRYMTVVPEIDMPGHTNAALASYASLNCDGVAPALYTGTKVGFSTLCVPLPLTYTFVHQVLGEVAALTPGPYLHIGGDEARSTSAADYATFLGKAEQIVTSSGKKVMGWHDIAKAGTPPPGAQVQFWGTTTSAPSVATAAGRGTRVVMSPANHAYLDMKYTRDTTLGQTWAGLIDVNAAYGWDPGNYLTGVTGSEVAGVEGPLWTETVVTSTDVDYLTFPRLPALAELGWSPWSTHDQAAFDARLAAQGPRWKVMGVAYYHSTEITWPAGA
jgi:hexosaminidase